MLPSCLSTSAYSLSSICDGPEVLLGEQNPDLQLESAEVVATIPILCR